VDTNVEFVFKENPTLDATFNAAQIAPTGGSQAHENMQPYLGINFAIALVGLYPSRS
jgi:microcystin-dependent protein